MYQNAFEAAAFERVLESRIKYDLPEWETIFRVLLKKYAAQIETCEGAIVGHIKGLAVLKERPESFMKASYVHKDIPIQCEWEDEAGKSKTLKVVVNGLCCGVEKAVNKKCFENALLAVCEEYELEDKKTGKKLARFKIG